MSAGICELVSCEAIQQTLDTAFGIDNMAAENLGTVAYVFSNENVGSAQVTAVTGRPSKINPVKVVYDQRFLDTEVEAGTASCIQTDLVCDLTEVYNFDTTIKYHKGFAIDAMDLANTCEENSALVARKIAKLIALLDLNTAKRLAAYIALNYGKWSVDTALGRGVGMTADVLQVNDYLGTSGDPNPVLMSQIRKALQKTQIMGGIVSGGDALDDYARQAFSRNGAASGWDMTEMMSRYGFAPIYDRYLADELASVNATNAAIGRGSVIPLVFNLFANPFNQMNDSTNIANVVFSAKTGIPYDFMITRACPKDPWSVSVESTINFVTPPDTMYKVGDNLEGVTNLALLNVTCTDLTPCQV